MYFFVQKNHTNGPKVFVKENMILHYDVVSTYNNNIICNTCIN